MENLLVKIISLFRKEEYGKAISVIDEAGAEANFNPIILVWKSRCLQLLNNDDPNGLKSAEDCLIRALELDREHEEALNDLGFFYLRVLDDARRAQPLFAKCLELAKSRGTEAVVGLAECSADLESDEIAIEFLDKNSRITLEPEKILETRQLFTPRS